MAGERYNTGAAVIAAVQRMLPTAPPGAVDVQAFEAREGMARSAPAATQQRTRVSDKAAKRAGHDDEASNPWPLRIGLGVAAVAVVGVLLWAPWRSNEPTLVPTPVTEQPVAGPGVATFEAPGDTGAATAMSADEIDLTLRQAEANLVAGTTGGVGDNPSFGLRLVGDEDSAAVLFQKVLSAQPGNERARKGIEAIADFHRTSATAFCAQERWIPCALFAGRGLQALPDDPELLKLKATAESAQRGL